jgi:hypothetical protein
VTILNSKAADDKLRNMEYMTTEVNFKTIFFFYRCSLESGCLKQQQESEAIRENSTN